MVLVLCLLLLLLVGSNGKQTLTTRLLQNPALTHKGKFAWKPTGYETWRWRGHSIGYIDTHKNHIAEVTSKPPLLLVHGFGASGYHWRYNIPALSEKYHVYTMDLLGFGFSDKPIIEYEAEVWRDQVLEFINDVISPTVTGCVVAGNSLGGFTALYAAATQHTVRNNLITGCVLLNAACSFRPVVDLPQDRVNPPAWMRTVGKLFKRAAINLSFVYTKQPSRIAQVLTQIYPVRPEQVDKDLVDSIHLPALHPNAAEVFYRVVSRNSNGPSVYADDLLKQLQVPLLLLWGVEVRQHSPDRKTLMCVYLTLFK